MKTMLSRGFLIFTAFAVCAFAQESVHVMADGGGGVFTNRQVEPGDKVVKGAPYTADAVTETVQTLANGTHITHQTTAQLARDSEGRTRREQTLDVVGPWATSGEAPKIIMLNDPVAGVSYHLDPKSSTAMKMPLGRGKLPPPDALPPQVIVSTANDGPGPNAATAKVHAEGIATAVISAGGMSGQPNAVSVFRMKEPGETKTESLGQQAIDGIPVTGTRTTRTIPAGAIGNDQPMEIVSETWYSKDLQMVIMSKHSDPQIGETTYKLTNIQQAEPPHAMFEVPPNYAIREEEGPIWFGPAPVNTNSK